MYFAIKDFGYINLKEINGDLSNKLETHNEIKIIKTKVNGETKVYVLLFNEVTNAKSLIMAHGGRYSEDKLIISDKIDNREYTLDGVIYTTDIKGDEGVVSLHADRCRFVEFPLIDELLKIRCDEITQFVSCLEVIKDENGNYIEFSK